MSVHVIRPGMLTTIQDLGRPGWRRYGVVVGGAMDSLAFRVANLLVQNEPGEAALEVTLLGPALLLQKDQWIAICGADLSPQVNGVPAPRWRPVWIRGGSELRFGEAVDGCRSYIAFAGGLAVPEVLGSRSTYLRGGWDGWLGRPLRAGDTLALGSSRLASRAQSCPGEIGASHAWVTVPWWAGRDLAEYAVRPTVRVLAGGQHDEFSPPARERFLTEEYTVSANSDRMGYRLIGPPVQLAEPREFLSEAMVPGTIQIPPDGQPMVMMADCPVTGGYPKIGTVIDVDLPVLAQLMPGATIRFQPIGLTEARQLYRQRERNLIKIQRAIEMRFKESF